MTTNPILQDIDQKKTSEISSPDSPKLLWEAPTAVLEGIEITQAGGIFGKTDGILSCAS